MGLVKNLSNNSVFKTLSKLSETGVGKVVSSPWFTVAVKGGFSAFNAYFNEGSETYKNVGKSVVVGVIDGITSIGPINGALIGAQIGGPIGGDGRMCSRISDVGLQITLA